MANDTRPCSRWHSAGLDPGLRPLECISVLHMLQYTRASSARRSSTAGDLNLICAGHVAACLSQHRQPERCILCQGEARARPSGEARPQVHIFCRSQSRPHEALLCLRWENSAHAKFHMCQLHSNVCTEVVDHSLSHTSGSIGLEASRCHTHPTW